MKIGILLLFSFLGINTYNRIHEVNIIVDYGYTISKSKKQAVLKTPEPFLESKVLFDKKPNQKPLIILKGRSEDRHPKVDAYLQKHIIHALVCERIYGVPAELALAQALVESGTSKANINTEGNNHHGFLQFDNNAPYVLYQVSPKYGMRKWKKFKTVQDSYNAYGSKVSKDMEKMGVKVITIEEIVKTNYSGKKKGPDHEYAARVNNFLTVYEIKKFVNNYKSNQN